MSQTGCVAVSGPLGAFLQVGGCDFEPNKVEPEGLVGLWEITKIASRDPGIQPAAFRTLVNILERHKTWSRDTTLEGACQSISRISKDLCIAERTVIRAIRQLEEFRYLVVFRDPGKLTHYSARYPDYSITRRAMVALDVAVAIEASQSDGLRQVAT